MAAPNGPSDRATPDQVFSALQEAAIAMHETFIALMESGFTERQALTLIADFAKGASS